MQTLELPVIRVWLEFEAEEPESLPRYLFSPLRGVLGAQLKRLSCVARKFSTCRECPLNQHCAYGYIFETPRPEGAERLRLYPYLPHPFTISLPYPTPRENPFFLGLTLVGRAIQYFPHLVLALSAAGEKGLGRERVPLRLKAIKDHQNDELYQAGKLKPPSLLSEFLPYETEKLSLLFETPVTLRFEGKLVKPEQFEFHVFIRNLLRRLSALSFFHAEKELALDFKGLIEAAKQIKTTAKNLKSVEITRYSARTKQKMPLRGLIGRVSFEGNLTPFTPLLRAGELVHVGKNTSFGFGHYKITSSSNSSGSSPQP
ncbi:hypothetical protein Thein_1353 [Thermodesulfatator indicus DSM 15286]|uniref:CRISPR-associated protein Cas6 C-terminal domain-containing protein n=1 Tax=Thermodesulfatator indicus (strain DSM 15286 / JCM 11887 / CIR29812) TaxID=667014 RepID=F8A9J4_THEID|nr:CRISPR system precrRNA processing endoribonuclease RAMP protein Cas6 [Thermodesulfatator indicus]AEH45220.1 hypothetical protein Thein_1353 [Thermodesulfatator indicus DSM 15286]